MDSLTWKLTGYMLVAGVWTVAGVVVFMLGLGVATGLQALIGQ